MINEKLLPCPFCGSHEINIGGGIPPDNKFAHCSDCLAATNHLTPNNLDENDAIAAWNARAAGEVFEPMSPCKYSVSTGDMINLIPKNGAVQRLAARQNAVCIQYFLTADEEGEYYRTCVWVECQDMEMQEYLLHEARKVMSVLPRPAPLKTTEEK